MFDALSNRLQDVFQSIKGETRLTEATVENVLREIRLALLEADVNFKVVKAFVDRVRDRAMDQAVLKSLTPSQQVIKIVRDELLALFGDAKGGLTETSARPRVILMLGLQGSGKTTTTGKLAKWLVKQGRHPIVVSTDVRRPAAIQQLAIVAQQAGVRVHDPVGNMDPVSRTKSALAEAKAVGNDVVIVDTAGRLHIDDELMKELVAIREIAGPTDLLYVADAMTGQDAIKSAGEFNAQMGVTGVVLTKIDGDARGGAALSVVSVVGVPIAFVGNGEKLEDLEPFHAAYLDGELPTSEAREVEAALARNHALRAEYEQLRDLVEQLRTEGPIAAPARLRSRLTERLAAEAMPSVWRRWVPRVPLEAVALAAVALFALILVSKPKPPPPPEPPTAAADTKSGDGSPAPPGGADANPAANGVLGDEGRPLNTAGRQSMVQSKKGMPPSSLGSRGDLAEKEPYLSDWEKGAEEPKPSNTGYPGINVIDPADGNAAGAAKTANPPNTATTANTADTKSAIPVAYSPPPYRYRLRTGSESALKTLASVAIELGGTLVDESGRTLATYPMDAGEARAVRVVVPSYNVEALHSRLRQMGDVETMAADSTLLYAAGADVPVAIEVERE